MVGQSFDYRGELFAGKSFTEKVRIVLSGFIPATVALISSVVFLLYTVAPVSGESLREKDEAGHRLVQMQDESAKPRVGRQQSGLQLKPRDEPVKAPALQPGEAQSDESDRGDKKNVRVHFAPGQYQQMEDSERLSKPSFEQMPVGETMPEDRAGYGGKIDDAGSPRLEDRPSLDPRPRSGVQTPDMHSPESRTPQLPPAQQRGQALPEKTPAAPGLPPMDPGEDPQDAYSYDQDGHYGDHGDQYHGYTDPDSNNWEYYGDEGDYYGDYYDYYGYGGEGDYYGYGDNYGGYYYDYGRQQHGREGLPYGTVRELDDIMRSGEAETQRGWEGQHEYPIHGDRPWYEQMYGR